MTARSTAQRSRPKLILASASPRRREILAAAGIALEVLPTSVPEEQRKGETAEQFVRRVATEKAKAARRLLPESANRSILGADTVVVLGSRTLGKPASEEDARQMLRRLSGKEHQVLTGVCLLSPPAQRSSRRAAWSADVRVASTTVKFCRLTKEEIKQYVASGEPLDKAGGYAIQGLASKYVEWIRGCYFNVVGLPVALVYEMLKQLGSADPESASAEKR